MGKTRRRDRRIFSVSKFIRRLGPDEPSNRSEYARGDGRRSSRHRRSSRRCTRRDSIRRSRSQSQALQTHACEIRREIFHRGTHPHEASMKATTVEATTSEASMEAGMMSLTRLGHFRSGIIRQSKERSR
jgi:hypothetical protein